MMGCRLISSMANTGNISGNGGFWGHGHLQEIHMHGKQDSQTTSTMNLRKIFPDDSRIWLVSNVGDLGWFYAESNLGMSEALFLYKCANAFPVWTSGQHDVTSTSNSKKTYFFKKGFHLYFPIIVVGFIEFIKGGFARHDEKNSDWKNNSSVPQQWLWSLQAKFLCT